MYDLQALKGPRKYAEAVVQRCSVRKVFLVILQNSQENTYARVPFLAKLQIWEHLCWLFPEIPKSYDVKIT